ncbi:winged helix-turn-helix domain-containing protein [Nocardia brevicatena]|uniref:winged helix-turn-helix domain-containing protein n=1 Tax=Nocardia brevicatena TaxID=37327 RepID=UPI00030464C8|nr:winged helix-turn-helix domain-containing protein [Nocardia brevicatena]
MQAAEMFAGGQDNAMVAKQLRVSVRSVQRRRKAWSHGGQDAARSAGSAARPKLDDTMFAASEAALAKGALAHGRPDQTWTSARIQTLIGRRFGTSLSPASVWQLLRRHGWSHQRPARRAVERDPQAVTGWGNRRGRG